MKNPRLKRRRAGKPKSRTGCLSCKYVVTMPFPDVSINCQTIHRRRKIKCDETRPVCVRCSQAGYDCEFAKPPPPARPHCGSTLLPKAAQKLPLSRMHPSGRLLIEVEIENRYFDHFQRKTTSGFQGIMDWSIWNHLILQLCHHEPFVRESVVAIGALIRSLEVGNSDREFPARDDSPSEVAAMHRQFAFLKYGRAVKAMQTALIGAEPTQILVACLLVFCFEILLDNRSLALSHVITGHRMLQDWLNKHHQSKLPDRDLHSPASRNVDDELVDAFEHLDLQISTIYDVRPIELHRAIICEGRSVIEQMPSTFKTLTEAGKYLTVIMKQSHHFMATTWQSTESSSLVADLVTIPPGPLVVVSGVNTNSTSFKVPDSLRVEQKPYAEDILRWLKAFQPLFQRTRRLEKVGSKDYVTCALLQMHAIATRILVAGLLFTEELSYDAFLPHFREMLALINIIVDVHRNVSDTTALGAAGFVLGLGITAPLYLLITRCRHRTLRRNGIEILRGWHLEACWDPFCVAAVGEFIVDVEEEGIVEGIIPESSRAVVTIFCEAPDTRNGMQRALIQCFQRCGGPDGGPIWKERMVYWSKTDKQSGKS